MRYYENQTSPTFGRTWLRHHTEFHHENSVEYRSLAENSRGLTVTTLGIAIAIGWLFTVPAAEAARNFIVRAGETIVINPETKLDDFYNKMALEDGARLVIETPSVRFNVGELKIGNNVQIIGNGRDGEDGTDAKSDKPTTGVGHGGWPGDHGLPGQDGWPGADFAIYAGTLYPIGANLRIELHGGDGGDGGSGGHGGHGGTASCHEVSGDGGNGGNGGRAGSGGNGGKLSIRFSSYSGLASSLVLAPDTFKVHGGAAGNPGALGGGGHGGRGADCPFFLGGARAGGRVGGNGRPGEKGQPGTRKVPEIKPI